MKTSIATGLACLLVLLAPRSAAAGASPCGPPGARTFTQGASSRVYVARRDLVACVHRSARRTVLGSDIRKCYGSSSGCGGVTRAAVAGRFVAYDTFSCCDAYSDEYFSLVVRDLRTGRRRSAFEAGTVGVEDATLAGVVVRHTGTAAWLLSRTPQQPGATATYEVRRSPGCGPTLLDSGAGIAPGSLRRDGARVTWRHGVVTRGAALC